MATTYPAKKALKGKLVTRIQYTNWNTPERTMNVKKASINLRRSGVFSKYDFQSAETVLERALCGGAFGPAICVDVELVRRGIDPKRKSSRV